MGGEDKQDAAAHLRLILQVTEVDYIGHAARNMGCQETRVLHRLHLEVHRHIGCSLKAVQGRH